MTRASSWVAAAALVETRPVRLLLSALIIASLVPLGAFAGVARAVFLSEFDSGARDARTALRLPPRISWRAAPAARATNAAEFAQHG